ncbi:MAG: dienelactone hydrolase family protein [Gemmatimonadaceae bacterium]|nr:dienelactone hydrolase family protein [Chitinophagaceae bacterium]
MNSARLVASTLCVLTIAFVSCGKDNDAQPAYTPQPLLNKYDSIVETSSPVLSIDPTDINGNVASSYVALPSLYSSTTKKYPLIIFMHGTEELGSSEAELPRVLNVGLGKKLRDKSFPANTVAFNENNAFVVLLPQFKKWPTPAEISSVIDYAVSKYRVDARRVYLSGVSMGGGMVWDAGSEYGDKVAAGVAFSSVTYIKEPGCKSIADKNVGLWVFHNSSDEVFPATTISTYIDLVNKYKPRTSARKTIFQQAGHDTWTKADNPSYREDGKNIYEWMLQFYKP